VGIRRVNGLWASGSLALAALLLVAATAGCGATRRSSLVPRLTDSVQFSGAVFHTPAGWRLVVLLPTPRTCVLERLLPPAASSPSPVAALKGDAIGLFPLRGSPDRCVTMRSFYDGRWRHVRSEGGLREDVSVTTSSVKAFGKLGVYEWRSIPSLDIGLQLFGYGRTVKSALLVVRAIAASASIGISHRGHERKSLS
jgi:hypothetical protein